MASLGPNPSVTADIGAAIPPDWSGLIPDLIVALFTGVFVGLFVLLAERSIGARARKREDIRRQQAAVAASERWMHQDLRYLTLSLLPAPSNIRRVRTEVRAANADPGESEVEAFSYLVRFLAAWEGLKSSAEDLEQHLKIATIMAEFGDPKTGILSIRLALHRVQRLPKWRAVGEHCDLHGRCLVSGTR